MRIVILFLLLCMGLSACDRMEPKMEDAGQVVGIEPIAGSAMRLGKTVVRTERFTVVILGYPPVPVNGRMFLYSYNYGVRYVSFDADLQKYKLAGCGD